MQRIALQSSSGSEQGPVPIFDFLQEDDKTKTEIIADKKINFIAVHLVF